MIQLDFSLLMIDCRFYRSYLFSRWSNEYLLIWLLILLLILLLIWLFICISWLID